MDWSKQEKEFLQGHYDKMSVKEISEYLKIHPQQIYKMINDLNLKSKNKSDYDKKIVFDMINKNKTLKEISEILNRSTSTVYRIIEKLIDEGTIDEKQFIQNKKNKGQNGMICWTCKHTNLYECCWFKNFSPVKGWEKAKNGVVINCPNYEKWERKITKGVDED